MFGILYATLECVTVSILQWVTHDVLDVYHISYILMVLTYMEYGNYLLT